MNIKSTTENQTTKFYTFTLPDDRELTIRQNQKAKEGYSLLHDLPEDIHKSIINRLLATDNIDDPDYILYLKQTCRHFHTMTNLLTLQYLKSQFNPDAFFTDQFKILGSNYLFPNPFSNHLRKFTFLLCSALLHPEDVACQVYVQLFYHHVGILLACSERSKYQYFTDPFQLEMIGKNSITHHFTINKYIFIKFLGKYFLNTLSDSLFGSSEKLAKIIDFLIKNQSLEGVSYLIDIVVEKSAQSLDKFQASQQAIERLAIANSLERKAVDYLLPRVIHSLSAAYIDTLHLAMSILQSFAIHDFLTKDTVQEFLETINKYINDDDIQIQVTAIRLLGYLCIKNLIQEDVLDVYIETLIAKFNDKKYGRYSEIISAVLSSLSCISKFLDFKRADELIPNILIFLNQSNTQSISACSFIQSWAEKGLDKTAHADVVMKQFIPILSSRSHSKYKEIFELCNKLLKTEKVRLSEAMIVNLIDIATKNLGNEDETLRMYAVELLKLVATPEDENKIVNTFIIQSVLECFQKSPGAFNFDPVNLISFFQNLPLNTQVLTTEITTVINQRIDNPFKKLD